MEDALESQEAVVTDVPTISEPSPSSDAQPHEDQAKIGDLTKQEGLVEAVLAIDGFQVETIEDGTTPNDVKQSIEEVATTSIRKETHKGTELKVEFTGIREDTEPTKALQLEQGVLLPSSMPAGISQIECDNPPPSRSDRLDETIEEPSKGAMLEAVAARLSIDENALSAVAGKEDSVSKQGEDGTKVADPALVAGIATLVMRRHGKLPPVPVLAEGSLKPVQEDDSKLTPTRMAELLFGDILDEVYRVANPPISNEKEKYLQDAMSYLGEICSTGSGSQLSMEEYIWIFYLLVQLCGVGMLVMDFMELPGLLIAVEESAMLILGLVDEVIENSEYLHWDSDDPERMAKNIVWQILNSRALLRRYQGLPAAECTCLDIMDEIIDSLSAYRLKYPLDKSRSEETSVCEEEEEKMKTDKEICKDFTGIYNIAEEFIEELLLESGTKANVMLADQEPDPKDASKYDLSTVSSVRVRHGRMKFPKIGAFSIETGIATIDEYVGSWDCKEGWLHTSNFMMAQSDACSDYYFYDVKFSLPTRLYPIAQVTASVYFTIEVSRVKPEVCPVDVTYKFESNSLVHQPYVYPFREEWLTNILIAKLNVFKRVRF